MPRPHRPLPTRSTYNQRRLPEWSNAFRSPGSSNTNDWTDLHLSGIESPDAPASPAMPHELSTSIALGRGPVPLLLEGNGGCGTFGGGVEIVGIRGHAATRGGEWHPTLSRRDGADPLAVA